MDNGVFSVLRGNNGLYKVLDLIKWKNRRTTYLVIQKFISLPSVNCLSYKLLEVLLAKGENKPRK